MRPTYRTVMMFAPTLEVIYQRPRNFLFSRQWLDSADALVIAIETFRQKQGRLLLQYGNPTEKGAKAFPQDEKQVQYNAEIDALADSQIEDEIKPLPWWAPLLYRFTVKELTAMREVGLLR